MGNDPVAVRANPLNSAFREGKGNMKIDGMEGKNIAHVRDGRLCVDLNVVDCFGLAFAIKVVDVLLDVLWGVL